MLKTTCLGITFLLPKIPGMGPGRPLDPPTCNALASLTLWAARNCVRYSALRHSCSWFFLFVWLSRLAFGVGYPKYAINHKKRRTVASAPFHFAVTNKELLQVKALQFHHLGPGGHEIVDELLLSIGTGIQLRQRTQY